MKVVVLGSDHDIEIEDIEEIHEVNDKVSSQDIECFFLITSHERSVPDDVSKHYCR